MNFVERISLHFEMHMVYKLIKVKHYIEESDSHGEVMMTPNVK